MTLKGALGKKFDHAVSDPHWARRARGGSRTSADVYQPSTQTASTATQWEWWQARNFAHPRHLPGREMAAGRTHLKGWVWAPPPPPGCGFLCRSPRPTLQDPSSAPRLCFRLGWLLSGLPALALACPEALLPPPSAASPTRFQRRPLNSHLKASLVESAPVRQESPILLAR